MFEIPPPTYTRLSGWSGYLEERSEINYVNKELIQEIIANNNDIILIVFANCFNIRIKIAPTIKYDKG